MSGQTLGWRNTILLQSSQLDLALLDRLLVARSRQGRNKIQLLAAGGQHFRGLL
jgi:hypothetical protein